MVGDDELIGEVQHSLNQLQLHATIMDMTIRGEPTFLPAREGWRSRLREIRDWAYRNTEEMHEFGEAYDSEGDPEAA